MNRHPAYYVVDTTLPIHKNDSTHFVIALPKGNALREAHAHNPFLPEYEYLDVFIAFDGRLDIRVRYHDLNASPRDKQLERDWNSVEDRDRITDLSMLPVETRQEIQRVWEKYLDTLAQVRNLALFPEES